MARDAMSDPAIGFVVLHLRRCGTDEVAHAAALDLLSSPSWGGALRYCSSVAVPGRTLVRRPGMIPATRLRDEAGAALRNPDVLDLSLGTSRDVGHGYRRVTWENDTLAGPLAMTYGDRPADGPSADSWIADVVTYADAVSACAGVVAMMADRDEITTECSSGSIGRRGGVAHPWPEQAARMKGRNARHLGTRYMRFPRWGTLISHDHVAQLGGVDAIVKAVAPAVVRPLSGGVYFQLTDSVSTAMSAEAIAKQQIFTDLAAPLLPPPVTARR
ncbi:MAG: hypothetical protein ABL886_03215 [Rhodoglobus sp.]